MPQARTHLLRRHTPQNKAPVDQETNNTMANKKKKTGEINKGGGHACSGATRHRMRPPMTKRQIPNTVAKKGDFPISKSAESTMREMKAPKNIPTWFRFRV